MKKARGTKSAKWLSDQTAKLGYRVSPTVIAKLDSGHRGSVLSVAELLVLAAALDIPPGLLAFPRYPYDEVELLPGKTTTPNRRSEWFSGRPATGRQAYRRARAVRRMRIELVQTPARIGQHRQSSLSAKRTRSKDSRMRACVADNMKELAEVTRTRPSLKDARSTRLIGVRDRWRSRDESPTTSTADQEDRR